MGVLIVREKMSMWSKVLRKYWYITFGVVLLVGVAFGWIIYQKSIDTKWAKATDSYRRADYDATAKILNNLPVPTKDEERLAMYAQTMLATRQLDKSADAYEQLYKLKKDPFAKLVRGNIYNEQKKYDEAAKIYNELIDANPSYVQAYVNLATLYKLQNNNSKAVEVAKQGVKNNPNNTILLELLVSLTMQDKSSQDFKEAFSQLKTINPNDPLVEMIEKES